jgi:membrane protein YqaA with SNARE-associated domain
MIPKKFNERIKSYVRFLQRFADRIWYPPLIGFLSALDNFIIIIPNDGILISSSMLTPKRWFHLALCVSIGSTVGAVLLAALVEYQGLPWILEVFPGINQTTIWKWTEQFFSQYGLLVVFIVAITPIMQQPAVILAALAFTPLSEICAIIFAGRFVKFLAMAYAGSHAPRLLSKMWGIKDELHEVGVDVSIEAHELKPTKLKKTN